MVTAPIQHRRPSGPSPRSTPRVAPVSGSSVSSTAAVVASTRVWAQLRATNAPAVATAPSPSSPSSAGTESVGEHWTRLQRGPEQEGQEGGRRQLDHGQAVELARP